MKLVSFIKRGSECVGLLLGDQVYDLCMMQAGLPGTIDEILNGWDNHFPVLLRLSNEIDASAKLKSLGLALKDLQLLAPVPHPGSLRDGYAFRQHVETSRRNRGLEMTAVFDSYPVFYFGNHSTVQGPGPVYCMPDHFRKLDFELEAAIVISKKGKNIPAQEADSFIAGLMILNDFSARTLQVEEMLLSLGPAKGKDFASSTGPWLVTLDELKPFETPCKKNHCGKSWNLNMGALVNGRKISHGNLSEMEWTFAELIERASYGAELYPGDIIGSGTVGTGCFLELNGTGKLNHSEYSEQWLRAGDTIELIIDGLGTLYNQIVENDSTFSILKLKK